jgi:hypothetical protein
MNSLTQFVRGNHATIENCDIRLAKGLRMMASERLAAQIRRIQPRSISVFVLTSLGAANVFYPATSGSTVSFIYQHTGITSQSVGLTMLIIGAIVALVQRKSVYFLSCGVFGLYALIAFIGALFREVPFNASIFALGIFLYTVWSFPDEDYHAH